MHVRINECIHKRNILLQYQVKIRKPKNEIRKPKQIRNPKFEILNAARETTSVAAFATHASQTTLMGPARVSRLGFRISFVVVYLEAN